MRWAILISLFYFVLLAIFFLPLFIFIVGGDLKDGLLEVYQEYAFWIIIASISLGQFLLLFLKVKELPRMRKPRARLWGIASLMGLFTIILLFGITISCTELFKMEFFDDLEIYMLCILCGVAWGVWMIYFYLYHRNDDLNNYFKNGISLLLKGSVFELMICIPAHIIVRQRDECCAGFLTGIGIACGFSVMLMCFGPIVLALIYKRMQLKKGLSKSASIQEST
ncbi:MAG: hypothetical protein COA79_02445 [Planctomycetota bacterium]|nr:MAG: hypothetical protein COA79_02445 [Planctomycetota bacterium]